MISTPLDLALLSAALFFGAAALSLILAGSQGAAVAGTYVVSAAACAVAFAAGLWGLFSEPSAAVLPIGLPVLPFRLRLDHLSAFFITVIALPGLLISIYSMGYVKGLMKERPVTRLLFFQSLFIAGMLLVTLADDAFFFLIAWELMALSSYFLVVFEDEKAEMRRAAFLYLLIAHVGAIMILLSFGLIAGGAPGVEGFGGYAFESMRSSHPAGFWGAVAFLLGFFGFAAKAGMVPLHVWLPEAHPVAPSNISALMSGVMLKVAIYGILRIAFDLLGEPVWWWGGVVLVFGHLTAVMGILYALTERDLKRLLAYSSVENVGLILIGIGLSMVFSAFGKGPLAALALTAALYHTINHAVFKGLLFMGAGSIVHATGKRDMEGMGGLIHSMPWTSALFLVGCAAIAALPPLNGFVSEWLIFQAFLLSPALPSALLNFIMPIGAAAVALTAALVAACFVRAYGVVFLGHWRGGAAAGHEGRAHEAGAAMKAAMALAALCCVALGVLPSFVIDGLGRVTMGLVGDAIRPAGWGWIAPVAAERASYSAPVVFVGILSVVAIAYFLLHARKTSMRRAPIWDCGFEKLNNRMQYTATSFSMPLRRVFGFILSVRESVRPYGGRGSYAYPEKVAYRLRVRDRIPQLFYGPVADAAFFVAKKAGRLQHGKMQLYLLYSFATIIILMLVFS